MSMYKIQNMDNGMFMKSDLNVPHKYKWTVSSKDASLWEDSCAEDALDLVRAHEGYNVKLNVQKVLFSRNRVMVKE